MKEWFFGSFEKFCYGQTAPLTKQQQEACVSAAATVALLRYICRRDLKYKADADKYGWGLDEKDLNDQRQHIICNQKVHKHTIKTPTLIQTHITY